MNVVVIGAQWGDEGKGKVVDLYSSKADYIVRFQGGNNAGHTLVVEGKKTILHIIPSGILHAGKTCFISNGVVFDPVVFFEELDALVKGGVIPGDPSKSIKISEKAHVIMPYHRKLDQLREQKSAGGKGNIGTTVRGIGPAYEDKMARRGILVIDLLRPELLKQKLERALDEKNVLFKHYFNSDPVNVSEIMDKYLDIGKRLRPYITDTRKILQQGLRENRKILFEGAQGVLLDVDHGTYPYVTSSSVVCGGVLTGCGLGRESYEQVIGIAKAYATRVGTGPFPTETKGADEAIGLKIRDIGAEYGATTGRPRRVGWLDLVALKYAVEVNGMTGIALMKSDVLQGFDKIKVCTSYRLNGKIITDFPSCVEDVENLTPVYEELHGWPKDSLKNASSHKTLPQELKDYMSFIESYLRIPIVLISSGPGREETIQIADPFSSKIALGLSL